VTAILSIRGFAMRHLVYAGLLASAGVLSGLGAAQAAVFDLSVTGAGISGAIDLALAGGDVTGGVGTLTIGTTTYTVSGLATYAGDDQSFSTGGGAYVDFPGISFALWSGGTSAGSINIFAFPSGSYGLLLSSQNAAGDPYGGPYYSVSLADPPGVPTVPELSTWAMLGLGFASLAVVAASRRKTAIALLG
jgi:hypothetical protein